MLNTADLTVIVPTRNEAENIGAFLATVPPWVHLIVVDKSVDATLEIVRRVRPRKTTILECAGTLTQARQAGAAHARSRWLLFTDADVAFDRSFFARAAAVTQTAGVAVHFGPKLSRDAFRAYYRAFAAGQQLLGSVRIPAASGSNLLVTAGAFTAVDGFDLRLSCNEDSELVWRLARAGFRWRFDRGLTVWATDHRRLRRGRVLKALHTVTRCALLYFDLIPDRWRSGDWGYWTET